MYHNKYLKYKEKYFKLKNQIGGQYVQLNGINYIKKKYSDLIVTFFIGKKKLKEFNYRDVFIRLRQNNTFDTALSYINIYDKFREWENVKCIRLFRVDEIIELPENLDLDINAGLYKVLYIDINDTYQFRKISLKLINLHTNIEKLLVLRGNNDNLFKLDTIYLYIPILSEHDKIHKNIKNLNEDKKFSSNVIIKKLWDNRENGDYIFNGLRVDSFILKLTCDVIKTQLQKNDIDRLVTNIYYNPQNKDSVYLFVYLMYHNNFVGCSININYSNLEYIRHMCDYYLVDQNIINYIDILRGTIEFDPSN